MVKRMDAHRTAHTEKAHAMKLRALLLDCPACAAKAGSPCTTAQGGEAQYPHLLRRKRYDLHVEMTLRAKKRGTLS